MSLAIKKFCTVQKEREREGKKKKEKNSRLVRGVNVAQFRGIFSSLSGIRNGYVRVYGYVKKYSRSIVAEDRKFRSFREWKTYGPKARKKNVRALKTRRVSAMTTGQSTGAKLLQLQISTISTPV